MKHDVKAPAVGESITEVRIAAWKKQSGEAVKPGDVLIEIESDKATVEVAADSPGVLTIQRPAGEMVKIGEVLGFIDDAAKAAVLSPVAAVTAKNSSPVPTAAPSQVGGNGVPVSPAVRKMTGELGIDPASIKGTGKGGRVTKGDVIDRARAGERPTVPSPAAGSASVAAPAPQSEVSPLPRAGAAAHAGDPRDRRVPMTFLRQRIAERLVQAQRMAAILTTFNECDMGAVLELRAKHKETFKAKHEVGLGFMSFFTRAVIEALKAVPAVNAMIDGKDAVYRDYFDIGVAVGTERGLVVPVLRDAGAMGFAEIEKGILALAEKAKTGKLSVQDLAGGTFTISNGGTYGSLLSTPILNPPQSGILGMHKIQDRPMAVGGAVVIRPMMYLALSYDHRMIDGKEAVTFLVKVKEGIEDPTKLGFAV